MLSRYAFHTNRNIGNGVLPAEIVCNNVAQASTGKGLVVVDLCSGKGCQGVLLALRFPDARIIMCDLQASHAVSDRVIGAWC